MKTRFLIFITFGIFLSLMIFIVFIYSVHLMWEGDHIGGGSLDSDPDLSPSYAYDSLGYLSFNSIFVAGPIMLGIISLVYLVPNIILRMKKIPTGRYMFIITACILMFFGLSYVENGLSSLTPERLESSTDYRINLIGALIPAGIGAIFIIPAIILLRRAKLRIRK